MMLSAIIYLKWCQFDFSIVKLLPAFSNHEFMDTLWAGILVFVPSPDHFHLPVLACIDGSWLKKLLLWWLTNSDFSDITNLSTFINQASTIKTSLFFPIDLFTQLCLLLWTHVPIYAEVYDMSISLLILKLTLSHIWHMGAPSNWHLCPPFFDSFLPFWNSKVFQAHLVSPLQLWNQPFVQSVLGPFGGDGGVFETNI